MSQYIQRQTKACNPNHLKASHSAIGNLLLLIFPLSILLHLFIDLELSIACESLTVEFIDVHIAIILKLVLLIIILALVAILCLGGLLALHISLLLLLSRILFLSALLPSLLELLDLVLVLVDVLVPHDLAGRKTLLDLGQAKAHSGTELDKLDSAALDILLFRFGLGFVLCRCLSSLGR
ncbi:hypothetical protein HG531_000702 [Fusarium graminearum]|nr:hypothetical protein HG531_000702 [Fusarium graminearum]